MQRFSYVGALLTVAALMLAPLSAQNRPLNKARVEHVIVRGSDDAMQVEIQTSGAPVAPDTQAISGPDRIVIDFPGALPAAELRALSVNRGVLKGVRSGLFFSNPPITRVVLDLTEPQAYRVSTSQNEIIVSLGTGKMEQGKTEQGKISPATMSPATTSSGTMSSGTTNPGATNPAATIMATMTTTMRPEKSGALATGPVKPERITMQLGAAATVGAKTTDLPVMHPAKLQTASLVASTTAASTNAASTSATSIITAVPSVSAAVPQTTGPLPPADISEAPPKPFVKVTFTNGMLSIRAEKATLSQVLFEVQRQTQADIAIPAGAEQEQVIADLGPAPARDVLAELLNGSRYNFIFVGTELALERVILTRRDSGNY